MELETRKLLNTLEFPIRWPDMDAYRHVNQARYLDAMSEARAQWLRQVLEDNALGQYFYFVAETRCEFYKSFKYPGVMLVLQYAVHLGRTSFTLEYDFFSPEEEKMYAKGMARMVCVNPSTERPARIPEKLRELLS